MSIADAAPAQTREQQALATITGYAWGNAAAGLIPIPVVDLIAFTGVQVAMVKAVAKIYDVPFQKDAARTVVMSLLSSLGSMTVAGGIFLSVLKFVPFLGLQAAVVTLPAVAGAITYAVGKVFIMHFEAGGTILSFDANAMKSYFREYYQQGLSEAKARTRK
jgi:uncharacterized protein (DUF697 family)